MDYCPSEERSEDEAMVDRIADGRTDLVFDYIVEGGSARFVDSRGVSLMEWCAYYGDVSAIRHLVSSGAEVESLGPNLDLNGAAFHGHWQLCQFLIEQGADPDYADPETGETALHSSLCKANRPRYEHVARVLLANGANPNAATSPRVATGAFMLDVWTRGETPLHRAAAFGSQSVIRLLLDAGGDREAKDANGDTPLSWASWHLRPASILRLLSHGHFSISDENLSTYDHGAGWSQLDAGLTGKPHL